MIRLLVSALNRRSAALAVLECTAIIAVVALSAEILLGSDRAWLLFLYENGWFKAAVIALACQVCFYFADLYDLRNHEVRDVFIRIVHALGAASVLLAILYLCVPSLIVARAVFIIASILTLSAMGVWRLALERLTHVVAPRERLLIVGTTPAAIDLARELFDRRMALGVDIVGFVDPDPSRVGKPVLNPGVIGTLEDIPSIVRARGVDRVVVSLADARGRLPMDKLLDMRLDGVRFDHLASVYEEYTGKIAVENLRPSWLIFSAGFRKTRMLRLLKRSTDVIAAAIGLLLAAPLMAIVAAAVKITSPGHVLYHQRRVGQYGRIFTVHKFRSMRQDAEAKTGAVWASKAGDPRVTSIGRFIRKTRLDELPQLWNVLIGDMSLVGPRPERPTFVEQLTSQIPFYGQRHFVRPGLTGWAQVRYTYGASVEDAMEKLQYDLFYIKNMSLAFDAFIALVTVKTVLLRRGAA
jgi:sugar transferase (PEP-CTERM system associated)